MNRIEITVKSLALNLFSRDLIRGALLCGGNMKDYNCMTIGWGTMGILWHKSVFIVYVRPNRHTFNYLEKIHSFTINFFDPVFQPTLDYCGTYSGRDIDKFEECEIHAIPSVNSEAPSINEAQLIIECTTLYTHPFESNKFKNQEIEELYPKKDYHYEFIGEIEAVYGVGKFKTLS